MPAPGRFGAAGACCPRGRSLAPSPLVGQARASCGLLALSFPEVVADGDHARAWLRASVLELGGEQLVDDLGGQRVGGCVEQLDEQAVRQSFVAYECFCFGAELAGLACVEAA
jgi:hypothetical protein